jgi:hypothetical protein
MKSMEGKMTREYNSKYSKHSSGAHHTQALLLALQKVTEEHLRVKKGGSSCMRVGQVEEEHLRVKFGGSPCMRVGQMTEEHLQVKKGGLLLRRSTFGSRKVDSCC